MYISDMSSTRQLSAWWNLQNCRQYWLDLTQEVLCHLYSIKDMLCCGAGAKYLAPAGPNCRPRIYNCSISSTEIGLVSLPVVFTLVYFALYCSYINSAMRQLRTKPSTNYKVLNMAVRVQVSDNNNLFVYKLLLSIYLYIDICGRWLGTIL